MAAAIRGRGFAPRFRLRAPRLPKSLPARLRGAALAAVGIALALALASYRASDPSLDASSTGPTLNWLGSPGALAADLATQAIGLSALVFALVLTALGLKSLFGPSGDKRRGTAWKALVFVFGLASLCGALAAPAPPNAWPLDAGLGGAAGDTLLALALQPLTIYGAAEPRLLAGGGFGLVAILAFALVAPLWKRRRPVVGEAAVPAPPKASVQREKALRREPGPPPEPEVESNDGFAAEFEETGSELWRSSRRDHPLAFPVVKPASFSPCCPSTSRACSSCPNSRS